MQDFSLQITKSRKSVQRNEERVREGEKRIALWKLPPLVEIRKPSGFPQRLGKHKTLSTVPTRPTCILFFKTLREARSTLNTLLFGPKDGEHLIVRYVVRLNRRGQHFSRLGSSPCLRGKALVATGKLKVATRYCLCSSPGSEPHLSVPFRPGLRTVHLPHFHRSDRLNGKGVHKPPLPR